MHLTRIGAIEPGDDRVCLPVAHLGNDILKNLLQQGLLAAGMTEAAATIIPTLQTALRRCQTQINTLNHWIEQEETTL